MLRMFIPTSNGKISRRRYIFSFILINFIFAFLIIFFNDGEAGFLVIVYIISIITMIAEDFACSGNGSMIFLICYFSTFSMLMLAPTDSSKQ